MLEVVVQDRSDSGSRSPGSLCDLQVGELLSPGNLFQARQQYVLKLAFLGINVRKS
jgi:hypothetical protein